MCVDSRQSPTQRLVAFFSLLLVPALLVAAVDRTGQLARAQELVDAGDTGGALEILDKLVKMKPPDAAAFLLRSTALFMIGDLEEGRRDLDRALEIDPSLRQAWLNRAALDLADKRYPEALEALESAKRLAPEASDNDLNIGAVLLLQGDLEAATQHFAQYLERGSPSAESHYLVATNYAMAGYEEPAVANLQRAIDIDEKSRLRARTDPNFRELESSTRFARILTTDTYQPPPGSHQRVLEIDTPFEGTDSVLLRAVLDALQFSNMPFDRRVEVTPDWALIWSEMRIKLSSTPARKGRIELTAPPDKFTPADWQQLTDNLIREIKVRLTSRSR